MLQHCLLPQILHKQTDMIRNFLTTLKKSKGSPVPSISPETKVTSSVTAGSSQQVTWSQTWQKAAVTFCLACCYLPRHRVLPPFGCWYQTVLLGDRVVCNFPQGCYTKVKRLAVSAAISHHHHHHHHHTAQWSTTVPTSFLKHSRSQAKSPLSSNMQEVCNIM